jgi:hypothetical protein
MTGRRASTNLERSFDLMGDDVQCLDVRLRQFRLRAALSEAMLAERAGLACTYARDRGGHVRSSQAWHVNYVDTCAHEAATMVRTTDSVARAA